MKNSKIKLQKTFKWALAAVLGLVLIAPAIYANAVEPTNTTRIVLNRGDSVIFDMSGSTSLVINLTGRGAGESTVEFSGTNAGSNGVPQLIKAISASLAVTRIDTKSYWQKSDSDKDPKLQFKCTQTPKKVILEVKEVR